MNHKNTNINGIILAGGKSSRMGRDKALLDYHGNSFLLHQHQTLKVVCNKVYVSSNHVEHQIEGLIPVQDFKVNAGPLAGLYSSISQSDSDLNLVLSCDVPKIDGLILKKLIGTWNGEDALVPLVNGLAQPLIAIYHKSCLSVIKSQLDQQNYKLQELLLKLNCNYLPIVKDDEHKFLNINTMKDLKELEHES